MDKLYTIAEVATKLNLSDKTLRRWEEAGRFTSSRTLGNQRRYSLEDLQVLDAIKHGTIESQKELLTLEQAANLCGVSVASLKRWENDGKIHPFITAGNTYYPRPRLIEKMEELKKLPVEPAPVPDTPGVKGSHTPGVFDSVSAIPGSDLEGSAQPPLGGGSLQGTVPQRNSRVQLEKGPRLRRGGTVPIVTVPASTATFITQVLITLILLLSYHLIFNSSGAKPVSPQASTPQGTVQGATAPDPRLDDLITKFQNHLAAELLDKAKPTPLTTIHLDNTDLIYGTATIPKGQDQLLVEESRISPTTPITLTFTSDYAPAKKYWVTPAQGSFTLHTDFPLAQDSTFAYSLIPGSKTPSASPSAQTNSTL